jgi:GH15 family glucan-1,4-alpha-glucosidase
MANFLSGYVDSATKLPRASYDLWEERYLTTTYTTAVTYAALITAADLAEKFGAGDDAVRWRAVAEDMRSAAHERLWDDANNYFYKGIRRFADGRMERQNDFDLSSFYGAYMFGLWPETGREIRTAYQTLQDKYGFSADCPRLPRYQNDDYFRKNPGDPSNPWFVTSLWLAQYNLTDGDVKLSRAMLDMTNEFMNRYQILSEQIDPTSGAMVSVAPLIWSHAEFVGTLMDYRVEATS